MQKLLILLFPVMLLACSNEPKEASVSASEVQKEVVKQPSEEVNNQPAQESTVSADTGKRNGPGLNLWIADATVKTGEDFCLDVTASEIKGLLSMQYSLRWDPKILEFKEVKGFNLPTLDAGDFGSHKAKEGVLTAVWIDETLRGSNPKDGDVVYQLCFTATGASGSSTPVRFWSSPTPFEVVVLPENIIPLTSHKGVVSIL